MSIWIEHLIADGYIRPSERTNPLVMALRIMALPFVQIGIALKINPNIVTLTSVALGLSATWLYYTALIWPFFLAWTASVILDYTDGTIARKTGKSSHFGYLLDMLGDRLKLLALVIAWRQVEMTLTADLLSGFVVIMLVSIEVITHVFVRHGEPILWQRPLVRVFLEFNMHSFFVLGISIAVGLGLDKVGFLWLAFILSLNFVGECRQRVLRHGRFYCVFNPKIKKHTSILSNLLVSKK